MARNDPAGDTATLRLQEAIDRLQEDVRRVEIWAGALSGFLKPVPEYGDEESRHTLPRPDRRFDVDEHSDTGMNRSKGRGHHGLSAPPRFSARFGDA